MDSVTQAVLGASICGSLLGRQYGRKALLAGAVLATLPDLDVFIAYPDPITAMVSHRGFSHSLFVLSGLSLLIALLWKLLRPDGRASAGRLGLAVWLTLITHPLLDALTSYGTQLLWPMHPTPTTWSTIFIIDPLYTLPLLLATVLGLVRGATPATVRTCVLALLVSSLYLAASVGAKFWAERQASLQLGQDGIQVQRIYSAAQPFSILLWRVVARDAQDK
ncbi:MAG TPA: metal-dependent hydrolase, partial [Alcaligenes sp.]|nr:metal-dependent hydrolase [Alcaligenes sp.]HRL27739.1 metal-dependent hydrolase [Alcaligenes sp.]